MIVHIAIRGFAGCKHREDQTEVCYDHCPRCSVDAVLAKIQEVRK